MTAVPGSALRDQIVIVTGASRGLGRELASALGGAGAAVALIARSAVDLEEPVAEIRAGGGTAVALVGDVRRRDDVARIVAEAEHNLGPTTLLVNNAGTAGPVGPDWLVDDQEWWECIEVSVRGSFLCAQSVLPSMLERRAGRIVNIVSTSGTRPRPYLTGTSVANTAQIRLTEGLAVAAKPHDVRVFAVHPGAVPTALTARYVAAAETWLPEYGDPPPDFWSPASRVTDLVLAIASGALDALSGKFLDATSDIAVFLAEADEIGASERLTLRLVP